MYSQQQNNNMNMSAMNNMGSINNMQMPYNRQVPQYNPYGTPAPFNYFKGRPVVSIDEAKATQIDFDGSLHIFTDLANKKIYTKQINQDGIAVLNVYSLNENVEKPVEYVTKEEFNNTMQAVKEFLAQIPQPKQKKTNYDGGML